MVFVICQQLWLTVKKSRIYSVIVLFKGTSSNSVSKEIEQNYIIDISWMGINNAFM